MKVCLNQWDSGSNTSLSLRIPQPSSGLWSCDHPSHRGKKEVECMIASFSKCGDWDPEMLSDLPKVSLGNNWKSSDLQEVLLTPKLVPWPLLIYEAWTLLERSRIIVRRRVMIWFQRTLGCGDKKKKKKSCIHLYSKLADNIVTLADIIKPQVIV